MTSLKRGYLRLWINDCFAIVAVDVAQYVAEDWVGVGADCNIRPVGGLRRQKGFVQRQPYVSYVLMSFGENKDEKDGLKSVARIKKRENMMVDRKNIAMFAIILNQSE